MKKAITLILSGIMAALLLAGGIGCGAATGTLQFVANGEDFVRQGFESKDGWYITFDHIYVTLSEVKGYQTDPAYDAHEDENNIDAGVTAALSGIHTIDLAEGDADADPILVGELTSARVGEYNAISWQMVHAESGDADGYSLVMIGTATNGDDEVDFNISVETEYLYIGGEYVGDVRKGILEAGETADLEMTFHFDHIFGDAETEADDELNTGAPGFAPFAGVATGGTLDMDMAQLEDALDGADYDLLVDILPTLGHVGEGHCHCEVI